MGVPRLEKGGRTMKHLVYNTLFIYIIHKALT